ncbi:hypothetical protein E2C01_044188 [Portunus trituberculatus]|uniref:Uncharacterized protein n=1 Tax=Portunus trituberculatus TaxID=210409 RepID=A0A5B7FRF3_PORTR|nr:hypothetical protein [Portunus trituberculatus]
MGWSPLQNSSLCVGGRARGAALCRGACAGRASPPQSLRLHCESASTVAIFCDFPEPFNCGSVLCRTEDITGGVVPEYY